MAVADLNTEFLAERELSRQRSVVSVSLRHSLTVSMKMYDRPGNCISSPSKTSKPSPQLRILK